MGTITVGRDTQTAQAKTLVWRGLKRILYAGVAGLLALGAARYGYDWWTVGRYIESTDDAYAGGNVTPISPHVAGFVAQILVADNEYVPTRHWPRTARTAAVPRPDRISSPNAPPRSCHNALAATR